MKPRVVLALLVLVIGGALAWSLVNWRNQPPEVPFAKVLRETIMSTVSTNGTVEPIEWAIARAERSGPVGAILIEKGKFVPQDAPLVEIDASDATAELCLRAGAHGTNPRRNRRAGKRRPRHRPRRYFERH